jgi:hypothetical protein
MASTPQTGRKRPASRVERLDHETPHRPGAVILNGAERSAGAPKALEGGGAGGRMAFELNLAATRQSIIPQARHGYAQPRSATRR